MLISIGSLVCHQIPERTLIVGSQLLPLCARCTGIYSGFLIGIVYQIITGDRKTNRLPSLAINVACAIFISGLIIEGSGEKLKIWQLPNQARFLMGLFCGGSISVILFPIFNYFLRKNSGYRSSIGLKHYIGLLISITLFSIIPYIPHAFKIISFTSIAGILILYLIVNMTVAGMALNWRNRKVNFGNVLLLTGLVLILFLGEVLIFKLGVLK